MNIFSFKKIFFLLNGPIWRILVSCACSHLDVVPGVAEGVGGEVGVVHVSAADVVQARRSQDGERGEAVLALDAAVVHREALVKVAQVVNTPLENARRHARRRIQHWGRDKIFNRKSPRKKRELFSK